MDTLEKIDETKIDKFKGVKIGSVQSRMINNNNNNLDKKSKILLDNNRKESITTKSSVDTQNKAGVTHPLPSTGLPAEVDYCKDSNLSKIRKNGRKIQKGMEKMNGSKYGAKKFHPAEEIATYVHNIYYDIRSPVAYSSYSKLYPHTKREGRYHITLII